MNLYSMVESKIYKRLARLNVRALKYKTVYWGDWGAFELDCIEYEKKQLKQILK